MATGSLVAAAPYLIQQRYQDYTADQHEVWAELVGRRRAQLEAHACREYLEGYEIVGLQDDRLPNLCAITERLKLRTGWSTTPVSGFLPGGLFLKCSPRACSRRPPGCAGATHSNTLPSRIFFTTFSGMCPCMRTRYSRTFSSTMAACAQE
jgi:hypothetical protein